MASKVIIFAGLLLLLATLSYAKDPNENEDKALQRSKRGIIGWIIASWGDALKLFLDGLNKEDQERRIAKRYIPILTTIIAGIGDGLKFIIDGLNIGTKGFLTGLTYLVLGWWTGWSNGLQKWRLGFYDLFNAVVNLAQNVLTLLLLSPLHSNFLGENHV